MGLQPACPAANPQPAATALAVAVSRCCSLSCSPRSSPGASPFPPAVVSLPLLCSIAAQPELKPLRSALGAFLRRSVGPWLAAKEPGAGGLTAEQLGELLRRLRGAEKALAGAS